ncbi:transcriptional regulator ATRX homolog [Prorops nasuta]|uniref:transcriptional regulator ATRX homolog n=1 Tax=Prorops nasuta TaxID=863751 RepID=UPI0034CF99C6
MSLKKACKRDSSRERRVITPRECNMSRRSSHSEVGGDLETMRKDNKSKGRDERAQSRLERKTSWESLSAQIARLSPVELKRTMEAEGLNTDSTLPVLQDRYRRYRMIQQEGAGAARWDSRRDEASPTAATGSDNPTSQDEGVLSDGAGVCGPPITVIVPTIVTTSIITLATTTMTSTHPTTSLGRPIASAVEQSPSTGRTTEEFWRLPVPVSTKLPSPITRPLVTTEHSDVRALPTSSSATTTTRSQAILTSTHRQEQPDENYDTDQREAARKALELFTRLSYEASEKKRKKKKREDTAERRQNTKGSKKKLQRPKGHRKRLNGGSDSSSSSSSEEDSSSDESNDGSDPDDRHSSSSSCEDSDESRGSRSSAHRRRRKRKPSKIIGSKAVDVLNKWRISFSNEKQESADSFLARLERCRKGSGLGRRTIMSALSVVLTGEAEKWHHLIGQHCKKWKDFEKEFKSRFKTKNARRKVKQQAKDRLQGDQETMVEFLENMQTIFSYMDPPLSEKRQLDIVYMNLKPWYRQRFLRSTFSSYRKLRKLGEELEGIRQEEKQRKGQATTAVLPVPSAMYVGGKRIAEKCAAMENESTQGKATTKDNKAGKKRTPKAKAKPSSSPERPTSPTSLSQREEASKDYSTQTGTPQNREPAWNTLTAEEKAAKVRRDKETLPCHRCRRLGHWKAECPYVLQGKKPSLTQEVSQACPNPVAQQSENN